MTGFLSTMSAVLAVFLSTLSAVLTAFSTLSAVFGLSPRNEEIDVYSLEERLTALEEKLVNYSALIEKVAALEERLNAFEEASGRASIAQEHEERQTPNPENEVSTSATYFAVCNPPSIILILQNAS